jgi:hypothetical protein
MCEAPDWLPPLLRLTEYGGDWNRYINEVFAIFHRDFIQSQPRFQGCWVRCRRDPLYNGKEAGFWHCVQEGADEQWRMPDLRRCERIEWVRAVIEHCGGPGVDHWTNRRGSDIRHLLWCMEEFLIVLGERTRKRDGFRYFQLITAYCTPEEHSKRRLRAERDASGNG